MIYVRSILQQLTTDGCWNVSVQVSLFDTTLWPWDKYIFNVDKYIYQLGQIQLANIYNQ